MPGTAHTVRDVMTHAVVTVSPDTAFKDIVRSLHEGRVSALPVVDGSGRVIGVVSEADLLPKEEFHDADPDRRTQARRLADLAKAGSVSARDLMTSPALTVAPEAPLARAARTMARGRVKRLPVVDGDGRPVGIVSRADLLKVFLRDDAEIAGRIRREVVAFLFPGAESDVAVDVTDGVVRLRGRIRDRSLVPVAARLARAVEGVVDVRFELDPPVDDAS
ncbi:CBS domain-containing protein [Streptomyces sp. XM83C]|uniref:CBS domain-containing protein n=1 Tax=Streptomyces thermocoprophilus TaxID=78356 RepID=A0ABV5VJR6_9ACTN|nr:CBS domain-containing protein [Streptomyces sp. XM83C]MCK1819759.1 CBS domain-containing protein [Streptomyces sp. XM83C]